MLNWLREILGPAKCKHKHLVRKSSFKMQNIGTVVKMRCKDCGTDRDVRLYLDGDPLPPTR